MANFSVYISTKDDISYAEEPIKQALQISDDIVIVDSSNPENYKKLMDLCRRYKQIRTYWVAPLGHREPLFYYALSKCKYTWVLHLNAFERMNESLIKDIHNIVSKATADIIKIDSTHYDLDGKDPIFTSQNIFLINKERVKALGYIHYGFDLDGSEISTLEHKYNVKHLSGYKPFIEGGGYKNMDHYMPAEKYIWRKPYGKKKYAIYLVLKWIYLGSKRLFSLSREPLRSRINVIRFMIAHDKARLNSFYANPDEIPHQLKVQQEIRKVGIIDYLHLYTDQDIQRINNYSKRTGISGSKLFVDLVENAYREHNKQIQRS